MSGYQGGNHPNSHNQWKDHMWPTHVVSVAMVSQGKSHEDNHGGWGVEYGIYIVVIRYSLGGNLSSIQP